MILYVPIVIEIGHIGDIIMFNSSNSSNVVWSMDYSNIVNSSMIYTTTTGSSNTVQFTFVVPRCRQCKHSHGQEGQGCYTVMGSSVAFVICSCKEHVPEDNLEYLEYLYKKKGSL